MLGRPDQNHVRNVCKIGKGAACCRYLAGDGQGMACVKHHAAARVVDARVAAGTMGARGNNCDGFFDQTEETLGRTG